MKKLHPVLTALIVLIASCKGPLQKDNYDELLKKIEINPKHEMAPPIASNIFFEELKEPDQKGNNVKFIAEFEQGTIKGEYLALMLNDEKVVLRDDGQGADASKGDNQFSLNLKEDLDQVKSELAQRQKTAISDQNTPVFKNRSALPPQRDDLKEFNIKEIQKGKITRIPIGIIRGIKSLSTQKKTLMITNTDVVEDPSRTFNPCTLAGNPTGAWTFGELMRQMASPSPGSIASNLQLSDFVRGWLITWSTAQTVNGENLPARTSVNALISNWETRSSVPAGGVLDMKFAPFKLIAIVNRLDLRGNSGYGFSNAGEGRFVFNLMDANCNPQPMTVIFEYGINKKSCASVKAFAQQWQNLSSLPLGSNQYNDSLQVITDQFVLSGTNPSKPNQNSINQVRTNDRALGSPWELREFNLIPSGRLALVDVKQEPQVKYNGFHSTATSPIVDVEKMAQWVNDNTTAIEANKYEVPLQLPATTTAFRGGHSLFPTDNSGQFWNGRGTSGSQFISSDLARHIFSLNTCSSCHGGETNTPFTHISPASFGSEAALSGFLTGITVSDPAGRPTGSPASRSFNDLQRREADLAALLANTCSKSRFFGLAHMLTFDPVRMSH